MVMKAGAKTETRVIPAGEFKAKCLQLMDEVKEKKIHLIVTKRGEPVVEIGPAVEEKKPFRSVVGRSPGVRVVGDIVSALPEEWTLPEWTWSEPKKRKGKGR